ncbi:MAG: acyl-CoA dehydrogenase family protein [Caulobacterales bacterium]
MDLSFAPEEIAFRDEIRRFLTTKLSSCLRAGMAASPTVFVEPEVGLEWQAILHKQGWLAYNWPAEYGGPGWNATQRYIFEKECALAGAPALPVLGLKLLAPVIYTFGTEAQKRRLLPRILTAEDYWCQGFSEPEAGSDLAGLKTRAVRKGDSYIINGSKIWTTHAHHANRIFCLVRTDQTGKRQQGITFLLIDMKQTGVTVRPIKTLAGDHEVNQVFFDDAVAPVSDRIGDEGEGWSIAKFLLQNERGGSCHAPRLLADLEAIADIAASEPDGAGGRLSGDREWRRRVARIKLGAQALEVLELRILAQVAKGTEPGPQTSVVKLLASNLRQDIDLLAVDVFAEAGLQLDAARPFYGDSAPEAHHSKAAQIAAARYLNSRAWTIFGGTNEVQSGIIAKTVLGL